MSNGGNSGAGRQPARRRATDPAANPGSAPFRSGYAGRVNPTRLYPRPLTRDQRTTIVYGILCFVVVLVILQPVVVGHWCSGCLLAALIMLPMVPLMLDEVVAMCQFMYRRVALEGRPQPAELDPVPAGRGDGEDAARAGAVHTHQRAVRRGIRDAVGTEG